MAELFRVEDVSFAHSPTSPSVLNGFNLSIEEGVRTAILGANGAGKTTLFYTLTGVHKPQEGQVLFKGQPVEYTKDGLRSLRSDVAVILQNPDEQIFCSLVEEDVAFGPLNIGLDRTEVEARVRKALRDVRMSEYATRPLQQLSGGQRKRVAIAGALAMHPKIMIMDEPTAGLDPQASMEVMELAEKLYLSGVTVLISTHDIDLIYKWADTCDVLCNGAVEYTGDSDPLFCSPETVYKCGLLTPSVFNMNKDISDIEGINPDPYPHNCCEAVAKFGRSDSFGTLICIPAEEEDAVSRFDSATKDAKGIRTGLYGSDVRHALEGCDVDFKFDALDTCFTQAVKGRDSILIYDPIYERSIKTQAARLKEFGADIKLEVE